MGVTIRTSRDDDLAAMVLVATEGGSPDVDPRHFRFVARSGRLLVAVEDDVVVGVAGSVPLGAATMVTDLFIAESRRGVGIGGRLAAAVTDGAWHRCTFSSDHPAALPVYASVGMVPRWRLLTMRGPGLGPDAEPPVALPPTAAQWQHDRADVVAHLAACGAEVGAHHVIQRGDPVQVLRLMSDGNRHDHREAEAVLRTVPVHRTVELSVPEHDPLAERLAQLGFEVVDTDIWCATDGVVWDTAARSVHRGLC